MSLTSQRRRRDEHGQVVVIFALFLVVLVLFAAVVFDAGALYLEQRQDVAAADAGALAGGTQLLVKTTLNKDQVGRDAVETARLNLRPVPNKTAWYNLFVGCTDGARDTTLYPGGPNFQPILADGANTATTQCVQFNRSFTKIRIRIPDQILSTSFSRVVGINTMRTYAVAEATISQPQLGSRVMPFAIQLQGTAGDLLCFRLDRTNCGNVPNNQGLRVLDAPLFSGGPATLTTALNCGSMFGGSDSTPNLDMTTDDRAASNAAMGLDHPIVVRTTGQAKRGDDCGPAGSGLRTPTPLPNWVYATQFDSLSSSALTWRSRRAATCRGSRWPRGWGSP